MRFTFLPNLLKEGEPQPTALSQAADLVGDVPDHAPAEEPPTSDSEEEGETGVLNEFGAAPMHTNQATHAHANPTVNTDPLRDMSGVPRSPSSRHNEWDATPGAP